MYRVVGLRLLTRLWLLAGSLSIVSLLLLGRCGIQESTNAEQGTKEGAVGNYVNLLEQREEETRVEVQRLTDQIRILKLQLFRLVGKRGLGDTENTSDCSAHVQRQLGSAELTRGTPLNNEYELISFSHFTFNRLYPTELGLGKRVVEKPIGYKRKDLLQVLNAALELVNRNATKQRYGLDDFLEGIYRVEPTTGSQYEVYFKSKVRPGFIKVTVMRPFAPLVPVLSQTLVTGKEKELIHIILPLSGRLSTFQGFMDKFVRIALKNDRRVLLTVVYFGQEGLAEARLIMSRVARGSHASVLRLLALNETFSRGKGLRVGAERAWDEPGLLEEAHDPVLFLCDVDIVFSARFLDRCRWNARPARSVYYPIVFSLYNPHVVYTLQGKKVPSPTDQLVISRDTGFWRDFGYGMTCQYKSDFLGVGGFSEETVGWGGEDVVLYRKYVRSGVKVVRATDPGVFHIWHPKVCIASEHMSADQYRACIRSRALNEASHAQLGFLAFKDDIATNQPQQHTKNSPRGIVSHDKIKPKRTTSRSDSTSILRRSHDSDYNHYQMSSDKT